MAHVLFILIIGLAPIGVARWRGNCHASAITALTLIGSGFYLSSVLGMMQVPFASMLCWVIALVWSFSGVDNPERRNEWDTMQKAEEERKEIERVARRMNRERGRPIE